MLEPLIDGEQIRWIGPVNHAQKQELLRNAATSLDALPELVGPALQLDRRKVRERAEGRFGYQRMVDDYLALYRALLTR